MRSVCPKRRADTGAVPGLNRDLAPVGPNLLIPSRPEIDIFAPLPRGKGGRRALLALTALLCATPAFAEGWAPEYWESYGKAEIETTLFLEGPRFPGQERHDISFALEPTIYAEWLDGDLAATVTAFARVDWADRERSHLDLRQAKFDYLSGDWEATVGLDKVFWGKTEAFHLVDIINQTDSVEGLDDEDSLGQPMLRVARLTDLGTLSAYWLPVFRKRTFAGTGGRLRPGLPVDEDAAEIRADGGTLAQSFALRFDGVFGDADIGLSAFHGVSRDPGFLPTNFVSTPGGPAPTALAPIYTRITQLGFDGQITAGATLWKAEAIFRAGQWNADGEKQDYVAATAGLEHTLYAPFANSGVPRLANADLGLIAEYAIDSRGADATVAFQNDIIAGARLALNDIADTSFLVTGALDHEYGVGSMRLEAQTRVGPGTVAEIEAQLFINAGDDPLGGDIRDDSFVKFKLSWFW